MIRYGKKLLKITTTKMVNDINHPQAMNILRTQWKENEENDVVIVTFVRENEMGNGGK